MASSSTTPVRPPVTVCEWLGRAGGGHLRLLDQRKLPAQTVYLDCHDRQAVRRAIRRLVVRGAPAIGVAAAYGMVVASQNIDDCDDFVSRLDSVAEYLEDARPTAVNLSWAVRRVLDAADAAAESADDCTDIRQAMLDEALAIHHEDEQLCLAIGREAAPLVKQCSAVLTHCNAGALATAGIGTATAGIYTALADGHPVTVYCDETRPLLQGSRLTAWELRQAGLEAVVITDSMAGAALQAGLVQMVITGADRIAANGDVANKIGTYPLAILARHHDVPFYVAAPYSTFDLSVKTGVDIPIEQRGSEEITHGFGRQTAPDDISTWSPAFDVTPAKLITGLITDRGIISPVNKTNIRKMLGA
jgi:methylthioribose-1-phosphate isomerase